MATCFSLASSTSAATRIFMLAGVPAPIVARLNAALTKAMSVESMRERYRRMGMDIVDRGQAEFAAHVRGDYEKWRRVAREETSCWSD